MCSYWYIWAAVYMSRMCQCLFLLLSCHRWCASAELCGQSCSVHLWTTYSFCIVVTSGIPWGTAYLLSIGCEHCITRSSYAEQDFGAIDDKSCGPPPHDSTSHIFCPCHSVWRLEAPYPIATNRREVGRRGREPLSRFEGPNTKIICAAYAQPYAMGL